MSEIAEDLESGIRSVWKPRHKVMVLLASHFGLTLVVTAASTYLWHLRLETFVAFQADVLVSAMEGILIGQVVLVACWGAFAGQPWYLRFLRFWALGVWGNLMSAVGLLLIEGESAKRLAEEHAALCVLQLLIPLAVLCTYGAVSARRFRSSEAVSRKNAWQFGIRNLLLLTVEAAFLLALARIALPRNYSIADFWTGLSQNRPIEILPSVVSVTILPVVFLALGNRAAWQTWLAAGIYLFVPAAALGWVQGILLDFFEIQGPVDWNAFGVCFVYFLTLHLTAAATILFTFYLLRRIGYDFRRRDEGPRGRNSSSNARNSAASASA